MVESNRIRNKKEVKMLGNKLVNREKINDYLLFAILLFIGLMILIICYFFLNDNDKIIINSDKNVKIINPNNLKGNNLNVIMDTREISINALPNEVVSKRTYNSRTFRNTDGSYTSQIGFRNLFFFDGLNYIGLDKISLPQIEKKEIILNKIPENNLIDFGTYTLHKGINVSIQNNELLIKDANARTLKTLPRPFSSDVGGRVSGDKYRLIMNGNNLSIFVEVDKNWLDNAKYPVTVDPTVQLDNSSGIYGGYVVNIIGLNDWIRYDSTNSEDNIPLSPGFIEFGGIPFILGSVKPSRTFIEFNTSSITSNAKINQIILNVNVTTSYNSSSKVNITRFNNTQISNNNTYPTNNTGDKKLFDDISGNASSTIGGGHYLSDLIDFQSLGNKTFNLSAGGKNATGDLQNQLGSNGYFAVGFIGDSEPNNNPANYVALSDSNSSTPPLLIVDYTTSCPSSCTYSGSGDWCVNQTCQITTGVTISGDLYIYSNGTFNMSNSVNVSFSGANRYIYVYRGGQIFINRDPDGATGFNK